MGGNGNAQEVSRKLMATLFAATSSLILVTAMSTAFEISGTDATGAAIKCVGRADDPHWSTKGSSVIYKTRVTCNAEVMVTIDGSLQYVGVARQAIQRRAPGQIVAESVESQWVPAGGTRTYYTPEEGIGIHIRRSGTYYGVSRGQIMSPCCSNMDGTRSNHAYVTAR